MYCKNCGAYVDDNTHFCSNCGQDMRQYNQTNQNQYNQTNEYYQTYDNNMNGGYIPKIQQRSIGMCILLSVVTCGIYGIYWVICLVDDCNTASNQINDTSGGMVFLLSIVTCNIYMLYWLYKAGNKINDAKRIRGLRADSNNGILYMILGIFSFHIVAYAIIQNELNSMATY